MVKIRIGGEFMKQKNMSEFFESLGAPLVNIRSWGAVGSNGKVLLRVWQHERRTHNSFEYVKIASRENERNRNNRWYRERLRHIASVRQGVPCYMIMCVEKEAGASSRIQSFNENELFVGGNIVDLDGDLWIQITGTADPQSFSA